MPGSAGLGARRDAERAIYVGRDADRGVLRIRTTLQ
jgi:hypothetical protein